MAIKATNLREEVVEAIHIKHERSAQNIEEQPMPLKLFN